MNTQRPNTLSHHLNQDLPQEAINNHHPDQCLEVPLAVVPFIFNSMNDPLPSKKRERKDVIKWKSTFPGAMQKDLANLPLALETLTVCNIIEP
jgi:hypothetical protein